MVLCKHYKDQMLKDMKKMYNLHCRGKDYEVSKKTAQASEEAASLAAWQNI